MSICIISATNRPGNLSIHVARHCRHLLTEARAAAEVISLEDLPREIAFSDLYGNQTPEFAQFQKLVDASGDFIFVVPEYNGSIPGILKLFIDACRYPDSFKGKRAALIGISAGATGNVTGLQHLRDILEFLGVEVLPNQVHAPRIRGKLHADGGILDQQLESDLNQQMIAFRDFAHLN